MSLDPSFARLGPKGAKMIDISEKTVTSRGAIARARVRVGEKVASAIAADPAARERVLDAARIAGIQAVKRTADLIPLSHPVPIDLASVDLDVEGATVHVRAEVRSFARSGLETEAMTAASIAALTVYDVCKALDRGIVVEAVYLEEKWGGKSGPYRRQDVV